MKIQIKLFLIIFSFSLILIASLVVLMQWSIGKGMINYVNTKEIEQLQPLIAELKTLYRYKNNWQVIDNNQHKFRTLLNKYLADSEFLPPKKNRPPPRRHDGNKVQEHSSDYARKPPNRRSQSNERLHPPPRDKERADRAHRPPKRKENKPPPINGKRPRPPEHRVDYALLDVNKVYVVGIYKTDKAYSYTKIINDAQVIGYLAISKRHKLTEGFELDFLQQQQDYLWIMALGMIFIVLVITFALARHLVIPINQLTQGMYKLTQGNYQQSLDVKRQDEFGQLSRDFNELAKTLEQNETARKRWLANISHELRTPVAILRGELEAMLDGVRQLSLDNIDSAHQEVGHLQNLIEDLHQLTSADIGAMKYRKYNLNLNELILKESSRYESYVSESKLSFYTVGLENKIRIFADPTRICQLLDNLINNAVKYARSGTQIRLTLTADHQQKIAIISVEDDGPGVEDSHLSHLFEHLYRVDNSRNRKTGGSGLGLSICSHIVTAHQGKIKALRSPLGGLNVIIKLPVI